MRSGLRSIFRFNLSDWKTTGLFHTRFAWAQWFLRTLRGRSHPNKTFWSLMPRSRDITTLIVAIKEVE